VGEDEDYYLQELKVSRDLMAEDSVLAGVEYSYCKFVSSIGFLNNCSNIRTI
jgi:hypothetical protein